MTGFITRRVLQALVVSLILIAGTFLLTLLLPGGPARGVLGEHATPLAIKSFNHALGYDRPLPVQFLDYLRRIVTGDLGFSYQLNESVRTLILSRLIKTALLAGLALLAAVIVGIPLGILQAVRRNRAADHAVTALAFTLYAAPPYLLGLLLVQLFAITWKVLPAQAAQGASIGDLLGQPRAFVLPVATLAAGQIALISRYQRSSFITESLEDYTRTARSKGASERRIRWRHVLRNAFPPVASVIGLNLPVLFAGSIIVESVFNYPGMGLLFWQAAQTFDYPVLLGCTFVIALATIAANLLTDLTYMLLDPRIKRPA